MSKRLIPAVAYLRKSTDREDMQAKSIDQQRAEITKLAKSNGYQIIREYVDHKSGWKVGTDRPNYERMIQDAERKADFEIVLVDDLDRFSREGILSVASIQRLHNAEVRGIHAVKNGFSSTDLDDTGSALGYAMNAIFAREYSRNLGRRVLLAKRNGVREGKLPGGRVPYGYRLKDGKLVFGPKAEVNVVRWMFEQYAKGRSLRGIATELNDKEVPSSRNGKWHPDTIAFMLSNPVYMGTLAYNKDSQGKFFMLDTKGEVVPKKANVESAPIEIANHHPAIVEAKLFKVVQSRMELLRSTGAKPQDNTYAFSGIVICGHCNKPMAATHVKRRGHNEYRCNSYIQKGKHGCEHLFTIKEDDLAKLLMEALTDESLQSVDDTEEETATLEPSEVETTERKVQQLEKRIDNACNALLDATSKEVRKRLDAKLTEMQKELERLQVALQEAKAIEAKATLRPDEITDAILDQLPIETKDGQCVFADPLTLREQLRGLGLKIVCRFKTSQKGKRQVQIPHKIRFQFGQNEITFQFAKECSNRPRTSAMARQ